MFKRNLRNVNKTSYVLYRSGLDAFERNETSYSSRGTNQNQLILQPRFNDRAVVA